MKMTGWSPRRPGGAAVVLALASLWVGVGARGSQPPDWLAAVLAAPAATPSEEGNSHALLEELTVRFLPEGKYQETYRVVIRVDSADGAMTIPMGQPFNADTDRLLKAQAWIVSPDRRHTTSYGRNEFLEVVVRPSRLYWNDLRFVGFARTGEAAAGGTIACELTIEKQTGMTDATCSFRSPRPVLRHVFEVVPLAGEKVAFFSTSTQIPPPVPGASPGSLRWELRDIAEYPSKLPRGFIPNPWSVYVRMEGPGSLAQQMKTWSQVAGRVADVFEPRMKAGPAVVALTQQLVQGKTGRWERIRAAAEGVQKQISYLSVTLDQDSLAGLRPRLPEEVMQSHLGDCKDKSILLVTMLRSMGEKAYPMLAFANNPGAVLPEWPSLIFNHAVVVIAADPDVPAWWPVVDGGPLGRLVVFDPTDPATPFGSLPQADQLGYGLVASDRGPGLVTMPVEGPEDDGVARKVEGELTERDELIATVDEILTGSRAARAHDARYKLGADKFRESLEKELHTNLPLLSDLSWTEDWEPTTARRHLTYKFKAANSMRSAGRELLLVGPCLIRADPRFEKWRTDCEGAVWVPGWSVDEEVRLKLPEGFSVDGLPKDWSGESNSLRANLKYRLEGRTLVFNRTVSVQACLLGKADYDKVYKLAEQTFDAERRPAVLRRLTTSPVN